MASHARALLLMFLGQLPTVLTLALLGGIAWWGYVWDWKIPPLPALLHPSAKIDGEGKKSEDKAKEAQISGQSLPTISLRSEDAVKAAGIETGEVQERLIDEYVTAHGHVDFDQNHYAHLSTRASGSAWGVYKQAGDEVKKGDVLALIASPELETLKSNLQKMLLTVQQCKRFYKIQKESGDSVPRKDRDSAEFALRNARIAFSKDQQSLQNLGLNISLDELEPLSDEQVADRLRTLGIPDTLRQRLDERTLTSNLLPMYAPFDGMVIKRDIVIGEMVTPATPQFVLADLRNLWIMLHVRLEDVGKLSEGQEIAFHLDGTDEDTRATIKWISAEVNEKTRTVDVRADVPNPRGRIRPGTFGDAHIVVDRRKRLIVPNEALQFDGISHFVFVRGKSPTEFQPYRVQLGPRHKDFTVVLGGLTAGQTIATSGSHVLLSEMLKERIAGED